MQNDIPLKSLKGTLKNNISKITSLNKEVLLSLIVLAIAWVLPFLFTATQKIMLLIAIVALSYSLGAVLKIKTLLNKNNRIRRKLRQTKSKA